MHGLIDMKELRTLPLPIIYSPKGGTQNLPIFSEIVFLLFQVR